MQKKLNSNIEKDKKEIFNCKKKLCAFHIFFVCTLVMFSFTTSGKSFFYRNEKVKVCSFYNNYFQDTLI